MRGRSTGQRRQKDRWFTVQVNGAVLVTGLGWKEAQAEARALRGAYPGSQVRVVSDAVV